MTAEDFEFPALFRKFPNLEKLGGWYNISAAMLDSLARNCHNLRVLTMEVFDEAYYNATFPGLVKLSLLFVLLGSETHFKRFLGRHQNLKDLYTGPVALEILRDLPTLLPNLEIFHIVDYGEYTQDDIIKLLLSWTSIKKFIFESEIDMEVIAKILQRKIMICNCGRIFAN